jgi:hypothetical protein
MTHESTAPMPGAEDHPMLDAAIDAIIGADNVLAPCPFLPTGVMNDTVHVDSSDPECYVSLLTDREQLDDETLVRTCRECVREALEERVAGGRDVVDEEADRRIARSRLEAVCGR